MSSAAEQAYTLQGIVENFRDDGRGRLDFRHMTLEVGLFPQAGGSARLQLGATDVMAAVTVELAAPEMEHMDEGRIRISVSCGPGAVASALPDYAASGSSSEDRILWLEAALEPLYSHVNIPEALRALCFLPGEQCWQLRVHAQLLRCDGCPLDAIAIAIAAALRNTRVPKMTAVDDDGDGPAPKKAKEGGGQHALDLDESLDDSLPFDCSRLPLYVTLSSLGSHAVADCTAGERAAAGSSLSLALDPTGRVCAIRAGGGFGLHLQIAGGMMQSAANLCAQLHLAAAEAFSGALRELDARKWPNGDGTALGLLA